MMAPDAPHDEVGDALTLTTLLGGRVGIAVMGVIPLTALALFLALGSLGFWSWSWVFFLLIPISGVIVYGFRGTHPRGR